MSIHVLVVDDDPQMVQSLCDVLSIKGLQATGVSSGEAAVDAVRRLAFDAVLMDVRMPGISGIEAFRRIQELRPALPVFLMTAYTSGEALAEATRQGVRRVLSKPLDLQFLFELLADLGNSDRRG